jgi:hypothetical protein
VTDLTSVQRDRVARAALAAAEAIMELGAAIAGDDVMDKIEQEDMPPEEREITRAVEGLGRGSCDLPLDECRLVHDHAPPEKSPP